MYTVENREDLSNWYIRRNRRRFWASANDTSKLAVYKVTYDILVGVSKLIAPFAPFVSEELYTKLTGGESVHLEDYPTYDKKLINEKIESRMDLVRDLISLGRNIREEVKIKVRQPINEALIDAKNEKLIKDLTDLIKEELRIVSLEDKKSVISEFLEIAENLNAEGIEVQDIDNETDWKLAELKYSMIRQS